MLPFKVEALNVFLNEVGARLDFDERQRRNGPQTVEHPLWNSENVAAVNGAAPAVENYLALAAEKGPDFGPAVMALIADVFAGLKGQALGQGAVAVGVFNGVALEISNTI